MPFYRVNYNAKYRFATVRHYGCVFRCPICSYKLRSGPQGRPGYIHPRPKRFLTVEEIQKALQSRPIETVYFMGGEPTMAKELPELLAFAKQMGARTFLGHCNGWKLDLPYLDGANVGLKAWDPEVHLRYTGWEKERIYGNVKRAWENGLELKINVVYVPGLVDVDQIEAIAAWLAGLSPDIPFHIMGYIPVPGQPYRPPTIDEMQNAVTRCRRLLRNVQSSLLSAEEALGLDRRDDRFVVEQIA